MVLLLAMSYVLIALLLLQVLFRSHGSLRLKISLVIVVSLFYVVTWYGVQQLRGWPARQVPPESFRLLAYHVVSPDKRTGSDGKIYLWIKTLKPDDKDDPRAYEVAYSTVLHQSLLNAGKSSRAQRGTTERRSGDGAGKESGIVFRFEDMPSQSLPAKPSR